MKVVILAGGLGTRLSEETDKVPKPMVEIGGMPILWHIMKGYEAFGFNEFVIACGYKAHVIKNFFLEYGARRSNFKVHTRPGIVEYLDRPPEQWEVQCVDTGLDASTGERVLRLREYLGKDDDFMLTYGDGVADVDVRALVETHHASGQLVTLTAAKTRARFGSLELDMSGYAHLELTAHPAARVVSFREKLDESWVNAGFMILSRQIFDTSYLPGEGGVLEQALGRLAKHDHVAAHLHDGFWQPMDTLREKQELERAWQAGSAPWTKYWKRP